MPVRPLREAPLPRWWSRIALKGCPLVRVPEVRPALALAADRFYGYPSRNFRLIGVTGTNGKTTTTHLIDALFRARGEVTGLLGTVGCKLGPETVPASATTPEPPELQEMFARLSAMGAAHVTMGFVTRPGSRPGSRLPF